MEIEYHAKPDESIAKLAEAQHEQYEREKGIFFGFAPFQLVARENGETAGVLSGWAVYREIYVDDLVTCQGFRGRGVGKRLLKAEEELFLDREIDYIHLVTNGFQAPGFYEKCGYDLEFMRKSPYDSKYDKYYFSKNLSSRRGIHWTP